MSGLAKSTIAAAVAATLAPAWPAAAQDIMSLQARLMQLEARVREITIFRLAEPAAVGGAEAIRQRILSLELTVAEMQSALTQLQNQVDDLKAARVR